MLAVARLAGTGQAVVDLPAWFHEAEVEMDEQVGRLRAAVATLGRRRRGRRIPSAVHALAVAFAARGRAQGRSWAALSREAGLSAESLRRWTQGASAGPGPVSVVPVAVRETRDASSPGEALVAAAAVVSTRAGGAEPLVLVSPRGYRLEGLGLGEARLLLEALS